MTDLIQFDYSGREVSELLALEDDASDPWGKPPARCDECGRFTKASDLAMVWGPMLGDGPDHEACSACRAKRRIGGSA